MKDQTITLKQDEVNPLTCSNIDRTFKKHVVIDMSNKKRLTLIHESYYAENQVKIMVSKIPNPNGSISPFETKVIVDIPIGYMVKPIKDAKRVDYSNPFTSVIYVDTQDPNSASYVPFQTKFGWTNYRKDKPWQNYAIPFLLVYPHKETLKHYKSYVKIISDIIQTSSIQKKSDTFKVMNVQIHHMKCLCKRMEIPSNDWMANQLLYLYNDFESVNGSSQVGFLGDFIIKNYNDSIDKKVSIGYEVKPSEVMSYQVIKYILELNQRITDLETTNQKLKNLL